MQAAEKRKSLRRSLSYPAWVDLGDGTPLRICALCDASQDGAQLTIADSDSVPDEFILALSADGAARRRCRVVWRTEGAIGVTFLKDSRKFAQSASKAESEPAVAEAADEPASAPAETLDIDSLSQR